MPKLFCTFLLCITVKLFSQPNLVYLPVITTGLTSPIDLVNAGDGTNRVFIAQQGGLIKVYDAGFNYLADFLTVTGIVSGNEQGLLSLAFHPDYENPDPLIGGFFYVYYTNLSGDLELARYHVSAGNPNVANPASKQVILTIPHPGQSNHNGAKLLFGTDGFLYFATGDGGGAGDVPNNAQNPTSLLGKMLRINVTNSASPPFFTIPGGVNGNPWAGVQTPVDTADAIWAFGLRNPFRWSFDRLNQSMWIGDVGQNNWEEINFRAAGTHKGVNYGWRCYEGNAPFNTSGCGPSGNYVFPVLVYPNGAGSAAVTGGVVYRGTYNNLYGYYFAADVYTNTIYIINSLTLAVTTQPGPGGGAVACFGETENGEVYLVSIFGNTVYRLTPDVIVPVSTVDLPNKSFIRPSLITNGLLNIFTRELAKTVEIIQLNGSIVLKQQLIGNGVITIPLNKNLSGLYIVRLTTQQSTISQKIMIIHQ
jgi:glucose/arabinose dehydrogenase